MENPPQNAKLSKRKDLFAEPDLIFGIDIGMCFTKVAYAVRESDNYRVFNFQSWMSLGGEKNATDYVPTVLGYEKEHTLQNDPPDHVGFIEGYLRSDLNIFEWFKEHFPGNIPTASGEAATAQKKSTQHLSRTDTVILYHKFLSKVYVAIKTEASKLLDDEKGWDNSCIEFIFSVPATWDRLTDTLEITTEKFRAVVKEAGFAESSPRHRVVIGLTEPEAAAAFCLSSKDDSHHIQFGRRKDGDKVLVVDAGGGTTDICLLDKRPSENGEITIDPLSAPLGEAIGSSRIDTLFERLARDKLRRVAHENNLTDMWDIAKMSRDMRESPDFQNNKRNLDMKRISNDEYFTVPIPRPGSKLEGAVEVLVGDDVANNQVKFDWLELAKIFDDAVLEDREVMVKGRPQKAAGLNRLIYRARDQLIHRGDTHSSEGSTAADIDLILLSGGLGSSEYIKHKIEESFATTSGTRTAPRVHTLSRPQMCVCRGLIENRILGIWRAAKCNGSYGILQRKPYRGWKVTHQLAKHSNHLHSIEGKRYVEQVVWLVKKNQQKPVDPPAFLHIFEPGSPNLMVEFVVSNEVRPSRFPSRGDLFAKVTCDLGEPARTPEGKTYCFVELHFHVARVEVKCWSSNDRINRQLIGQYMGDWETRDK